MSVAAQQLLRLSLRTTLRSRKFLFAVLVSLVPVAAGIITVVTDGVQQDDRGWTFDAGVLDPMLFVVLMITVPLTALIMAGGQIADDIEERTLTYLLVRPVRRRTLYVAKALPVLALTGILAASQALGLGLARGVAWMLYGQGTVERIGTQMVPEGELLLHAWGAGIAAATLAGIAFAALFGFVSLVTPRFHFFGNLLVYLAWELPWSQAGPQSLGFLTFSHHAASVLEAADPFRGPTAFRDFTPWWFAAVWILVWAAAWVVAGGYLAGRRDFNVTSAAA